MRIYEGSPRQDYEEVYRSVGAFIDQRGMRELLVAEAPDGFIVQGLVGTNAEISAWSDPSLVVTKETYTFLDEDIARFLEDGQSRRQRGTPEPGVVMAGPYEQALRVLGRYIDEQKPRDVFFFEQEGSYVLRLLMGARAGAKHVLVEFTAEEIVAMVEAARRARMAPRPG